MPELSKTAPETISEAYYSLTAAEKRCADYVLAHQQEAQFLSITELAEVSNVAEATVSRFCRRLGYRGYNAFKLALANAAAQLGAWGNPLSGEVTKEDSLEDVCRKLQAVDTAAISQTLEMIRPDQMRKAAKMLRGAKRVLCMGQGGSMLIAEEAAHLFSTVGGKYQAVRDSHMQAIAIMAFPSENGAPQLCGGIWGFGIFNNGDEARIEAAKQFIRWMADSEHTVDAVKTANFFAARTSAEGTDLSGIWADNETMNEYQVLMPYLGDYYNVTKGWAQARTSWWNMLQKVGEGADIKESLTTYAAEANAAAKG